MQVLIECGELRLDFSQRGLQGGAACGIRGPLRENVFALKVQSLFLPFGCGSPLSGLPSFFLTHLCLSGARGLAFGGICHLLFHRFTFPTTRHIFILRAYAKRRTALEPASNQI